MKHRFWKITACIAGILILICLYKLIFIAGAEMVIRFGFTGLDNMFHPRYQYYAVVGSSSTGVPAGLVKAFYPDWDLERDIYSDENDNCYYVSIRYSPDGIHKIKTPVIDIGGGDKFIMTYREWTQETNPLSPEMLELLRTTIMDNYDFDEQSINEDEGWVWRTGSTYGLDGFLMVSPKGVNDRAVLDSEDIIRRIKNGRMSKIMNCPSKGDCEYIYFTDRW